jgi:cation diffusion facilitator family transporter
MTPGVRMPADLASRAAMLSFATNFVLLFLKVGVGLAIGSVAVLSDGLDSAQDAVASAVVLVSVRYARRPPDPSHPYGHGRIETLAAITQANQILAAMVFIVYRAIDRLLDPPDSIGTGIGLITMVFTAVVNFGLLQYVSHAARVTGSPAISADARHLWSNVVQALVVIAALAAVALTGEVVFDPLFALALSGYLAWTGLTILRESLRDVMDSSLPDEDLTFIEAAITSEQREAIGFHTLRSRRSGQERIIDFHLLVRPDMTVERAHQICDHIEARIQERWPDARLLVHFEPAPAPVISAAAVLDAPVDGERGG